MCAPTCRARHSHPSTAGEITVQLDADDLLAQIRADWPVEFELSQLRLLTARQAAEIDRLNATAKPPGFMPTSLYGTDSTEGRRE